MAWVLATGAAMALSWYGVRTVLIGTAYEPPQALPISSSSTAEDRISATHRPSPPAPTPSKPPAPPAPTRTRSAPQTTPAAPSPTPETARTDLTDGQQQTSVEVVGADSASEVQSYSVEGGQAVFDLKSDSADLVSATPNANFEMRVFKDSGSIRVDFVSGSGVSSIYVTWSGQSPSVYVVEQ